ncbi:hypothetical protein COO60DRAFT_1464780 [Scenedesmus sp. NREL 46B-D3]|nr:hypothetical protein COO60DRAFT_1464780 [Scenedesmus sp. NREL 46B-D3]
MIARSGPACAFFYFLGLVAPAQGSEDTSKGQLLGTASLIIERKFIHSCGKVGHIEDVVVDAAARGHKVGQRLIDELVCVAKQRGCYKVILDCAEHNIPLYEKCGLSRKEVQMVGFCLHAAAAAAALVSHSEVFRQMSWQPRSKPTTMWLCALNCITCTSNACYAAYMPAHDCFRGARGTCLVHPRFKGASTPSNSLCLNVNQSYQTFQYGCIDLGLMTLMRQMLRGLGDLVAIGRSRRSSLGKARHCQDIAAGASHCRLKAFYTCCDARCDWMAGLACTRQQGTRDPTCRFSDPLRSLHRTVQRLSANELPSKADLESAGALLSSINAVHYHRSIEEHTSSFHGCARKQILMYDHTGKYGKHVDLQSLTASLSRATKKVGVPLSGHSA